MSNCTWAGVPICLDTAEVHKFLQQNPSFPDIKRIIDDPDFLAAAQPGPMPLYDTRIMTEPRSWPGPYLVGITYPFRYPTRPKLRPNMFYYPNGATRWAEAHFLISESQYALLASKLGTKQTLIVNTVSTGMFGLSARILAKVGNEPGLYLLTLVDERYFFQYKNGGTITLDDTDTWASLISYLATQLGISISAFSVGAVYGQPQPLTDLGGVCENAAILLDACLTNVGLTLVRNFNGTYSVLTTSQSVTQETANSPSFKIAGGNNNVGVNLGGVMPGSVTVTFPYRLCDDGAFVDVQANHLPFGQITGSRYIKEVTITQAGYGAYTGIANTTKTFHDNAEAWVLAVAQTLPTNKSQLDTLALKIAQDYYAALLAGLDLILPCSYAWTPEGNNDILWVWSTDSCYTRIQRTPWNYGVEELLHHFPGPPCVKTCNMSGSCCSGYVSASGVVCSGQTISGIVGTGYVVSGCPCSGHQTSGETGFCSGDCCGSIVLCVSCLSGNVVGTSMPAGPDGWYLVADSASAYGFSWVAR